MSSSWQTVETFHSFLYPTDLVHRISFLAVVQKLSAFLSVCCLRTFLLHAWRHSIYFFYPTDLMHRISFLDVVLKLSTFLHSKKKKLSTSLSVCCLHTLPYCTLHYFLSLSLHFLSIFLMYAAKK